MRRGMHVGYWWESQKERDHYEEHDVGGWIILKRILEVVGGCMDWIDLAQERDQWWALVNTVMNLRVLSISGKFLSRCTIGGFSRRAQLREVSLVIEANKKIIRQDRPRLVLCMLILT
jgi:hypothetical protein